MIHKAFIEITVNTETMEDAEGVIFSVHGDPVPPEDAEGFQISDFPRMRLR